MIQKTQFHSLADVAEILNIQPYQVVYLLNTHKVPEPKVRIGNRRAFDDEDIERLQEALAEREVQHD